MTSSNIAAVVILIVVLRLDPQLGGRFALVSWNPELTQDAVMKHTGFKFDASCAKLTPTMTRHEYQALICLEPGGEFSVEVRGCFCLKT